MPHVGAAIDLIDNLCLFINKGQPHIAMLRRSAIGLYGAIVGGAYWMVWRLLRCTVRVQHVNAPLDKQHNTVDCAWHETLLPYMVGAMPYSKHYVWMNHPAWYMKGIHLFLQWVGVRELVLGSSGHGGRKALEALVPLLQQGASTFLNPDGPYGPPHRVKDGVLDLAEQSGLPVIAIHVKCKNGWRISTWDRKWIPKPWSSIVMTYSAPWTVTPANRELVRLNIEKHLNGGDQAH